MTIIASKKRATGTVVRACDPSSQNAGAGTWRVQGEPTQLTQPISQNKE